MIGVHSNFRLSWDVLIAFLAFVSCIFVTWQLVFNPDSGNQIWSFIYFIDLIFIIDIGLNFFTSYRDKGVEVTEADKTARRYARTMLPFDVIANFPWEIILLFVDNHAWLGVPLLLWLRAPRFLRVIRLFAIFRNWESLSWANPGLLRIIRFGVAVALVTHLVACSWFFTASAQEFPVGNWAETAGIEDSAPVDQYVRSLYWAITTMTTVGFGDITPKRTTEYLVAMIVMLLGATLYAFIIGSIASLLSSLNIEKTRHRDKVQNLSYYLQQRGASADLNNRVRGYYEYLWSKHRGVAESDLLNDLPRALQIEIKEQLAKQVIQQVPLFEFCSTVLKMELLAALQLESYGPGIAVVREGEKAGDIFFIVDGNLAVTVEDNNELNIELGPGEYFGYLSLVLNERRTASVVAKDYCDLMRLSQHDYNAIMKSYPEFRDALSTAAAHKTEKMEELVLEGVVL
jgi:hypothetical protein